MRRLLALVVVAGCAHGGGWPLDVARLEATRDVGDGKLLAARRDVRALHGLGRVGGDAAVAALQSVLTDEKDEALRIAAVEGLWYADTGAAAVAKAYGSGGPALDAAVARALGKLATTAEVGVLEQALGSPSADVRRAAGVAAGVAGRRKIAFTDGLRAALVKNVSDPDDAVRTAAAYGLGADATPQPVPGLSPKGPPELRAYAVRALATRGGDVSAALQDPDVWVQIEAVRALSGAKSTTEQRAQLAAWIAGAWSEAAADSPRLHPILEGLTRLQKRSDEPPVAAMLAAVRAVKPSATASDAVRLGFDDVDCLAAAALARHGGSLDAVARCGGDAGRGWPVWARRQLLAAAIKDGAGTPAERGAQVAAMWSDKDLRVRVSAVDAAATLLPDAAAETILRAALADEILAISETAADSLGGLGDKAPAWAGEALAARAETAAREPELYLSILDALVEVKAARADEILARAAVDPSPPVRAKAREKLGDKAPAAIPGRPPLPPVDPASVVGSRPVFTVTTTRGVFHVELDPDVAPWNVAALVALAEKGFYDGTFWHRVVPGFVVQGGDPTGTGAGGPGYTVPAEPSTRSYTRGVVGIADAGKDTGGSQWFVMHAPAPHLDGRYTIVGRVPDADMAVVDRLQVGDRIVTLRVAR